MFSPEQLNVLVQAVHLTATSIFLYAIGTLILKIIREPLARYAFEWRELQGIKNELYIIKELAKEIKKRQAILEE